MEQRRFFVSAILLSLLLGATGRGMAQDAATAEKLLPLLKDVDPTVRIATVQGLAALGHRDYASPLVPLLADEDGRVRWAVADALRTLQAKYLEGAVAEFLKEPRGGIRAHAVFCLGVLGSRSFVGDIQGLLRDPDPRVRASAAFTLGDLGEKSSGPDVAQLLADEDARVRWVAMGTLRRLKTDPFARDVAGLMSDRDPLLRWSALKTLGVLGAKGWIAGDVEKLLSDPDPAIRRDAALAAELLDLRPLSTALGGLLADPEPSVRWAAVRVLHRFAAVAFLSDVQKLLEDPDRDVRRAAAAAVPTLEGKKAAEAPVPMPQVDGISGLDPTTVFVFGGYSRRAVQAADSLEKGVHWSVALSLGRIPGRAGVDDLESLMKHPLPELRRSVVWILEEWESRAALEVLRRAGEREQDPGVKAALREAIRRMDVKARKQ